ncbi:MAG: cytochrome c biogenesis protein CcsA [Planctomycetes bacterium]|nr:cytochrome c biogenesis protein CcsA [Planctomycetota bacterium]
MKPSNWLAFLPLPAHLVLGWALVLATLYLVCFAVPMQEETLQESYLIFYFHFPSAISCLVLFVIAGLVCIYQLSTGSQRADLAAASAVEVGLLGCTITLVTGMVWAKAAWGKPWIWHDKRLLTVAIMWFTYLGYYLFRMAVENPVQRARYSAVLGVLFAINVPLVWFAIRLFGQVSHPMTINLQSPFMKSTQWFGALAFFILYLAFWRLRYRALALKSDAEWLEETVFSQPGR